MRWRGCLGRRSEARERWPRRGASTNATTRANQHCYVLETVIEMYFKLGSGLSKRVGLNL